MGLFGWGEKDSSTPQERKDWRDNAKKQMDEQRGKTGKQKDAKPVDPPRHGRRGGGLFS